MDPVFETIFLSDPNKYLHVLTYTRSIFQNVVLFWKFYSLTEIRNKSNIHRKIARPEQCRALSEPGGTRWLTGEEVKGKLANGVGSQYSQATSERGLSSITQADAHTSAASSRLNWRPHRFKWTRPFRRKTKSGFCACTITFRTSYTAWTDP